MKFVLELSGQRFLMSAAQLEAVSAALGGAELLENKYVGATTANNGTNYVQIITPSLPVDVLKVSVLDDNAYETIKLATKLHADKK